MKTNFLRSVAVALGLSVCVAGTSQDVQAESNSYQAPPQWNTFNAYKSTNVNTDVFRTVGHSEAIGNAAALPAPVPMAQHSTPANYGAVGSGCAPCQSGTGYSSPYANAVSSNWDGGCNSGSCGGYASGGHASRGIGSRLSSAFGGGGHGGLYPWFGGASLLFMNVESNSSRSLLIDDATGISQLNTNSVDPNSTTGFDIHAGRYLANGLYGLDLGYFHLDPSLEEALVFPAAAGDFRATMLGWNGVLINPVGGGLGVASVYDYFDLAGGNAAGYRVTRDLSFQGLEANLFSFGLMGSQRVGSAACGKFVPNGYRFASPTGAVSRARSNRAQVMTSHGFRWFQFEDAFEFAANIDGTAGYQADDIYYNVDTENNLFGYQFGSRVNYCLTNKWNLSVGGKAGIYGNNVEMTQRLGTLNNLAYLTAAGVDDVMATSSDTVLSALGELDLGLGYRINHAWSIQGGYRMLAACGVATAPGSIVNDFTSLTPLQTINADDCVILHGGYVGLQFNW